MEIGTSTSSVSLVPSLRSNSGQVVNVGGQPVLIPNTPSLFGDAATISIGGLPVAGFKDYTNLGASGAWQFNLAGVLNTQASALTPRSLSPEQEAAEAEAVKQAFDLINVKEYLGARNLMTQLLKDNPTNAAAIHALGYAWMAERDYEQAEQLFLKAHAIDPTAGYNLDADYARLLRKDDAIVLTRARALVESGQRSEGIRLLLTLTERSPGYTPARVLLGTALLDDGDGNNGLMQIATAIRNARPDEFAGLESLLADLIRAAPGAVFVRQLAGKLQLRQGRYEEALATFLAARQLSEDPVANDRDLASAYVGIGRERLRHRDIAGAITAFEQAKTYDATGRATKEALAEAYIMRAERAVNARDYKSAAADYALAADTLGTYGTRDLRARAASGAYLTGRALERARIDSGGAIDTEVVAFQAAYELDSENDTYREHLAEIRNALGDQHTAAGELEEAAAAYKRAYELDRHNASYKANTINAYLAWGDDRLYNLNYSDAIDAYLQAFNIDRDNEAARLKLANGYNARGVYYRDEEEDYRAAVKDFKNALRLFPDNPEYQANYDTVAPWDY